MTQWLWKRWVWSVMAGAALAVGSGTVALAENRAPEGPKAGETITLKFQGQPDRKVKVIKSTRKPDGTVETEVKDLKTGETFTLSDAPAGAPSNASPVAPASNGKSGASSSSKNNTTDKVTPTSGKTSVLPWSKAKPEETPAQSVTPPKSESQAVADKRTLGGRLFNRDKSDNNQGAAPRSGAAMPAESQKKPGLLSRIFGKKPATPAPNAATNPPAEPPSVAGAPPATVFPPATAQPTVPSFPPPAAGTSTGSTPPSNGEPPQVMPSKPLVPSTPPGNTSPPPSSTSPVVPSTPVIPVPAPLPATKPTGEPPRAPTSTPAKTVPTSPAPPAPPLGSTVPGSTVPVPTPLPSSTPTPVPVPLPSPPGGVSLPSIPAPQSRLNQTPGVLPASLNQNQPAPALAANDQVLTPDIRPYAAALRDAPAPSTRITAARGLAEGRHGSSDQVKRLLFQAAQSDPCPGVRACCIEHLCKLGYYHPAFLAHLKKACDDPSEEVCTAAKAAQARMSLQQP